MVEEGSRLELYTDQTLDGGGVTGGVNAGHAHATGIRLAQPLDHLQCRGLAGAIWPEDAEDPIAPNGEIDSIDCNMLAIALDQPANLDDRLAARRAMLACCGHTTCLVQPTVAASIRRCASVPGSRCGKQ